MTPKAKELADMTLTIHEGINTAWVWASLFEEAVRVLIKEQKGLSYTEPSGQAPTTESPLTGQQAAFEKWWPSCWAGSEYESANLGWQAGRSQGIKEFSERCKKRFKTYEDHPLSAIEEIVVEMEVDAKEQKP